jgi:heterodisulfide reductase subunit A
MKQVMVVGGGISGLTAAVDLARLGMAVELVENSGSLGGHAAQLSCKATDRCVACGACVVEEKIRQATGDANIRVHLNSSVVNNSSSNEVNRRKRFDVTLKQDQEMQHIEVDAVLIASGFAPFHPANKPYGYGRFENVMTTLELDLMLRKSGAVKRPSDAAFPRNMAFIQCVGSRDSSLGHLWCSKICCGAALRMASCIQKRQPGMKPTFFYVDVQNFGKNFQACYADAQQHILIRSIPADVLKTADDRLKLSYFDPDTQAYQEAVFDMVILSVGLTPSESTRNLAAMLNIDMDSFAYARKTPALVADTRASAIPLPDGVFAAGAALEPMSIAESVLSAGKAASDIFHYMKS